MWKLALVMPWNTSVQFSIASFRLSVPSRLSAISRQLSAEPRLASKNGREPGAPSFHCQGSLFQFELSLSALLFERSFELVAHGSQLVLASVDGRLLGFVSDLADFAEHVPYVHAGQGFE